MFTKVMYSEVVKNARLEVVNLPTTTHNKINSSQTEQEVKQ